MGGAEEDHLSNIRIQYSVPFTPKDLGNDQPERSTPTILVDGNNAPAPIEDMIPGMHRRGRQKDHMLMDRLWGRWHAVT